MAVYLSIIFFILLIASFYKNRASVSIRFLVGILMGWIVSIVSLVLYLSKHNYYWQEVRNIFYINKDLWQIIIYKVNIRPDMLIRGINIGVVLLYYSAICFGIAFVNKASKQNNKKYMLLGIAPIIQIILFDPITQKYLQVYMISKMGITFTSYNLWLKYLIDVFKVINLSYCIGMVGILVNYYISHPKIQFLKTYTLFNIICLTPIIGAFYYVFRWWPYVLIKATMKKGHYNYLIPNLQISILNNRIYYLIFFIAFVAIAIYIYKYSTMENYHRRDHANIEISMDTASLGLNAFTHAIKNHLQGIKSESEYLSKKHKEDEDTLTSLEYVLASCEFCFKSLEYANKQLKNIDLKLKLISIDKPIQETCEKFQNSHKEIQINYIQRPINTMAYIDEEAFKEVIGNLIENAVEAIKNKEDGQVVISIREQGRWGVIELQDNGAGIEDENIGKIFTPFFSTKSSINNWGVGLAFCYRVIEAHDGKLTVESQVGEGTTFSIALPII